MSSSVREIERSNEGLLSKMGWVFFEPMGAPSSIGSRDPCAPMLLHGGPVEFLQVHAEDQDRAC